MVKSGALHIIEKLSACGYRALLAGGCVRDWVLGREPLDWDVATNAAPDVVMQLFEKTVPVGVEFGIVVVILEDGHYEVARFRRDGPYLDGRHPDGVEYADEKADAARRDFTVNGLFYDPLNEELIDYVGGRDDLARGLLRAIGDPVQRFSEDYLRMLRAVRFATRLRFAIDPCTFDAIRAGAENIQRVSIERIRDECTRILTGGHAGSGMQLLLDSGLLMAILPEVAAMVGVAQPPQFHPEGDVWTHVKMMLENLRNPSPALAWSTLLHDIGKPPTFALTDRIRFNGHDALGAKMAAQICQRLHMSNEASARICELTAQHMRIGRAKEMRPSKLKRLLRLPIFPELLELHRLDCLASHKQLDVYDFCKENLRPGAEADLHPPILLNGMDLIEMGLEPGPLFKEILKAVEDEQLEGRLRWREESLEFVRQRFAEHFS